MGFFIWLLLIRFCTYTGSKRVIGGFNGFVWGCLGLIGLFVVVSSRRLDDERANAKLIKEYQPVNGND
jgi:hypothetical protein